MQRIRAPSNCNISKIYYEDFPLCSSESLGCCKYFINECKLTEGTKTMKLNLKKVVESNVSSLVINNVIEEILKRIETLITERFATTQKMIWNQQKAIEAITIELSNIKASVKGNSTVVENLAAAINMYSKISAPSNNMEKSKEALQAKKEVVASTASTNNSELIKSINKASLTELRSIYMDNKELFAGLKRPGGNPAMYSDAKIKELKASYIARIAGNTGPVVSTPTKETTTNPEILKATYWEQAFSCSHDDMVSIVKWARSVKGQFTKDVLEEQFEEVNELPDTFITFLRHCQEQSASK